MALVPPIPYKQPVITAQGFLTEAWAKWFRQVFARIGGLDALSNTELEALPDLDLAAVESDVAALQLLTTSLQTRIAALEGGLTQGPQL